MDFKRHSEWEGKHAALSASKPAWLNYTDEKMFEYVENMHAAQIGTRKHALAAMCISLKQELPHNSQTLNLFVNDAIGYRMRPEVVLFYSPWAFGTADAIGFRDGVLRVFDLKTGRGKTSEMQLMIYAAYFCLEYGKKPSEIEFDLRIYQNDDIFPIEVDSRDIDYIMDRTKEMTKLLAERLLDED